MEVSEKQIENLIACYFFSPKLWMLNHIRQLGKIAMMLPNSDSREKRDLMVSPVLTALKELSDLKVTKVNQERLVQPAKKE